MANVVDFLLEGKQDRDRECVLAGPETVTYRELCAAVNGFAALLNARFGTGKNILLLSENSIFYVVSYLAIMKSGNVAVLIETRISDRDLDDIQKRCQFSALCVQEKYRERFPCDIAMFTESSLRSIAPGNEPFGQETRDSDLAAIIFTSGSTGTKKGVMLTHRNIMANTSSIVEYLQLTDRDRIAVVLPLYYSFGASLLHTHLRAGGSIVLCNHIFLGAVIGDIDKYRCTGFSGVPSTYQILILKTKFLKQELPSLRYFTQAGGQLPNKFIQMSVDAFPGKQFFVMYGATEATARLSYLPPGLVLEKLGSIGRGIPGVKLEVLDPAGHNVGPGQVGEIVATGDNIMKGYYGDPEGTSQILKNGRLYTGDLATVDEDGFIYIVGRASNIIKSAGYRISPKEVEDIINTIDGILGCVVVGLPDEIMGEAVGAVVQAACDGGVDLKSEVLAICNRKLPSYKVPRYVIQMDEFPLNASNKIDYRRIKELARERVESRGCAL